MNITEVNVTKQRKISAGLAGVEEAKNISRRITEAVQNGSFSFTINGTDFVPDVKSLNFSEPELSCDKGQALSDGVCGNLDIFYAHA